jgi:putative redox protein
MDEALAVSATWEGGYTAAVQAREHRITIDEPVASGGDDRGMMPTEALCAAVASCFCLAVAHVARRDGVALADLRVDARAERAGRELRYDRIIVTTAADVPEQELAQLVERARRVCWVSNTLAQPPTLEYRSTEVP